VVKSVGRLLPRAEVQGPEGFALPGAVGAGEAVALLGVAVAVQDDAEQGFPAVEASRRRASHHHAPPDQGIDDDGAAGALGQNDSGPDLLCV
jgi:hypothetical protein